jgi:hypothetical protein
MQTRDNGRPQSSAGPPFCFIPKLLQSHSEGSSAPVIDDPGKRLNVLSTCLDYGLTPTPPAFSP